MASTRNERYVDIGSDSLSRSLEEAGLYVRDSRIHSLGCYTSKVIPAGMFVVAYKGDLISAEEAYKREADSTRPGIYTFWINDDLAIDALEKGNIAKYINHSCDPNCHYCFKGNQILIYASRDIDTNEELTIDYSYGADGEKIGCACGALKCRGVINSV
jgi:SET domain-containing protein